ncbi:hypothetical protein L7F22_046858 [Adiantum nelumboides]|nr:hypothetical protein [Adiantum nelumboides]
MRQTIPLPMSNAGCFGGGSVFQAMIIPSPALHGFMPDNAYGATPQGGSNPMYGNIGVLPGFQCAADSYGMPGANMGMAGFSQPDALNLNMAGRPSGNFGSGMPLLNAPAYDNLTPKGEPKNYKEGGQAVKFDTFHGTHDKLKALLFLQQFDAAFAGGNFIEASKIRKAATFLKTNALQWWTTLLNQGVHWNQLSAINCESLEEYNAKFWDALLPVSSFKMVPLAEQIEKYCCGLPKGIKNCTKTSVVNMAQLMVNAEVADDLIQGKPDEDGFKTRRKEPQGKQFSAKGNVTSRLTVPPFKKKPFAGRKPFAGNMPFNTGNRPNAENQQFRPPFSRQRQGFKRHFTGKTIEERKALRDAKKCYICEGYFANECPQRNSQNKDDKSDRKGKKPKPSAGLVPDLVGDQQNVDATELCRACALSVTHLRTLSDYGCPNDERRAVASFKRLKDHFQKQEKSFKGIASSDLNSANPRLSDVMRLLYVIAELAQKDGPPNILKRSVLHLLEEITKLTSTPKDGHIDCSKTSSNSSAVLQKASQEKSYSVHAKLGLQGSSSSSESESLAGSINWECPRCSHYNHESKNACVQCNFQRPEKSNPIFDTGTPKSRFPVAKKSETKVGGEDEEPSIFASKRPTEMIILDDDNRALSMGELPQNKRLLGSPEQLFQTCTMSEKEDEVFGVAGAREDNDAGDLNIFDDIFDKRDTSPARSGPKRSLFELIRENKKAFSLTRKERDPGIKGMGPFTDRGHKYDENNSGESALQRAHVQNVSDLETEGKCMSMQQSRGNRGRAAQNHFNCLAGSVGKGLAGQVKNDDRERRTKSMQLHDKDRDVEFDSLVSTGTHSNERSKSNTKKHRDGREGYSNNDSGSRGGFKRRVRDETVGENMGNAFLDQTTVTG